MTRHDAIHPADRQALHEKNRFAAAIRSGDLLFVSGQVGSREHGSPEPDFAAQVRLAFHNLAEILAASGCTFADIVDVTSFHTDLEAQFEAAMAAREEALAGPPVTNWTALRVNWLASFDVGIKVVARIPAAA